MRARFHVLILGGDADGNLGDRAILMSMTRELRAAVPDVTLSIVTSNPARARAWYGAHPLRKGVLGLIGQCRAAARSDVVLCGGGGLFQDDDSLVKMPYWGLRVALARLFCRRVVGVALGVGPLRWPTSRLFARLAFACMDQVSVRDPAAQRVAQPLSRRPVTIAPDPALLLPAAPVGEARAWLERHGVTFDSRPLVGVALRRWFPPRARLIPNLVAARFRRPAIPDRDTTRLVACVARALDDVVARHQARVVFLPSYTLAHEGDDRVCDAVRARMQTPAGPVLRIEDPALYKGVAGLLDVLLSGRMHPLLLAASAGTPVVGLAYNQKFHGLFEMLDLSRYVLDVEALVHQCRADRLAALLTDALCQRPTVVDRATRLGLQFRALVARLRPSPA